MKLPPGYLLTPRLRFVFFLIILCNFIVFYPSFFHVARSDHIVYLANTASVTGPALMTHFYSYDRMPKIFNAGVDDSLFRPLFFVFLGLEKWLWGNHFMLWQITGFTLHLFVVWNLFRLLLCIDKSSLAVILTLFYSVLFPGAETVIWDHVNAHLIYISLILVVLRTSLVITEKKQFQGELIKIYICLAIISFFIETGFIIALLIFAYLKMTALSFPDSKDRRKIGLLVIPPILYCAFNVWDFVIQGCRGTIGLKVALAFDPIITGQNLLKTIYWFLAGGLFPSLGEVDIIQRTKYFVMPPSLFVSQLVSLNAAVLNSFMILFILCVAIGMQIKHSLARERRPFVLLVLGLLAIQVSAVVIGRLNVRQLSDHLSSHAYYSTFFWIYFVILMTYCLKFSDFYKRRRMISFFFLMFWLNLIIVSSVMVYKLNIIRKDKDHLKFSIAEDIRRHVKGDIPATQFSFVVEPRDYAAVDWIHRNDKKDLGPFNFFQLIYPKYYDPINPKCVYVIHQNSFTASAATPSRRGVAMRHVQYLPVFRPRASGLAQLGPLTKECR